MISLNWLQNYPDNDITKLNVIPADNINLLQNYPTQIHCLNNGRIIAMNDIA